MFELKSLKRPASAGLLALAGVTLSLTQPAHTQAVNTGKDVVVTNTAAQPVPVRASQDGTWGVMVENGDAAPVPTYDARDAREPFQAYLSGYGAKVMVPEGKRLVIEHVGLYGQVKDGVVYGPVIRTSINGDLMAHQLSFDHSTYLAAPASGNNRYEGSKSVRIYADPGTRVDFLCFHEAGTNFYAAASLSGYLVPAP